MKKFLSIFLLLLCFASSAQVKKYIRKASKAATKNQLEKARTLYLKAYELDKTNYKTNLGLGITLSEFMDKPEEALPYLETAYAHSPKDTMADLIYALGKCYHHKGEYQKALTFYHKLDASVAVEEDDKRYHMDLKKRIEDCEYGLSHTELTNGKEYYVVNAGTNINSKMSEYVPVMTPDNMLLFTSRRQDSPKEKVNPLDGKYYEAMYASKIENGRPQNVRRYTVPDLYMKSKFKKGHESVISISPDGKTLFVFRDSKIYEVSVDAIKTVEPKQLSQSINFDYYQSHAYLGKDDKTLLFTSESEEGLGDIDIYQSTKGSDGQWSKPINLGKMINTPYDEDSPYLSDDGQTLFFASKGHPGYGSYDIYKSTLENGQWSSPENLGQPINSPAHDIFLINVQNSNSGYFASSRTGGHGDMDIYKINYIKDATKECTDFNSSLITFSTTILDEKKGEFKCVATLNDKFTIFKQEWKLNGKPLEDQDNEITGTIPVDGTENIISSKILAYCDTCFELAAICKIGNVSIGTKEIVAAAEDTVRNPYDPNLKYNYLTKNKLKNLGITFIPVHFNLNKSNLRQDAVDALDKNAEILLQHKDIGILIYGFADSRGTEAYNITLSKNRATQVKEYLLKKGVPAKQIKLTSGKGEQFLTNNCTNDATCDDVTHEQNRRVEFLIIENK